MNMKNKLYDYYRADKIYLWEWILAAVIGMLVFCSVAYVDLKSLTIGSAEVWDVTADSNIFHLYEYSAKNIYGVQHQYMGSELMSVLPWSVWNLPIWIAQRFFDIKIISSPLSLAWSKLFLVGLSVLMLYYTYKICMLITENRTKSLWCVFFTSSSFLLYLGVFYAGQNDIMMITASVIAVYYLLCGKNKAFLIWSAVAISIKPFFLIAFFAVILLKEKNFIKIFLKSVIAVSGLIFQKILFMKAPMYSESMNQGPSGGMIAQMFPANLQTSFGRISFFAIALVIICFYAYTRRFGDENDPVNRKLYLKYVIYTIVLVYSSYLMLSPFSYYRVILLVPFLYIMICANRRNWCYSMLFDTAMLGGLTMQIILRQSNFCQLKDVNGSLFQWVLGYRAEPKTASYVDLFSLIKTRFDLLKDLQPLFSSIALISVVMLLVLNHPQRVVNTPKQLDDCPRILLWARMFIIVPFILALLYLFTTATGRIY